VDLHNIAEWVSAVATLLAVIVALFAARIERLWQMKPRLDLVDEQVTIVPPDAEGKIMVFLCIENRGRAPAERAEVFVRAVSQRQASGSYERVQEFVPMSLRWAHSEPDHPEVFVTILPTIQRYCILGALKINQPQNLSASQSKDTYFELWTEYKRSPEANELQQGNYKLTLLIGASAVTATMKEIQVTITPAQVMIKPYRAKATWEC
jgi:hypothetical protein